MRERRNVSGQAYGLTLLTPVTLGREAALRDRLAALARRERLVDDTPATHIARWVVIERLSHEGPARRRRQPRHQYLLFTCVFDLSAERSADAYLEALCRRERGLVDAIWVECSDFPGHGAPPETVAAWLVAHQVHSGFAFAQSGHATVDEVKAALRRTDRLRAFALRHQLSAPATLQREFEREFAEAR